MEHFVPMFFIILILKISDRYLPFVNSQYGNCIAFSIEMLHFHVIIMEYLIHGVLINFLRRCSQYREKWCSHKRFRDIHNPLSYINVYKYEKHSPLCFIRGTWIGFFSFSTCMGRGTWMRVLFSFPTCVRSRKKSSFLCC